MKVLVTTIILAIVCLSAPAFALPPDGALVRIDSPPPGAAASLLREGVEVVRDAGWYLVAVAGPGDIAVLERLGWPYDVLDASVAGKIYYTITRPLESPAPFPAGGIRLLYSTPSSAVVQGDADTGDLLSRAGFDVQRIYMRPVVPSPERAPVPAFHVAADPDSVIQEIVDSVSGPVIDGYVQRLQDFVTRWARHDSCQAAADWIKTEFESFGMDSVYYQHFSDFFKDNVVAVLPGKTYPEQIIVIGGHYDSTSNDAYTAPGADDNASGTACVLQCARILSGYEFDRTIVFVAFGAEEQGLAGSEYFAARAALEGDNIMAMVNVDMLGYLAPGDILDVDVISNSPSEWLRDRALMAAATYVPGTPAVAGSLPMSAGSDHMSFWDAGFDAIMLWEDSDNRSPYIHTWADSIGTSYNTPFLAEQSTRMVAALLADLAGPVDVAVPTGTPPPLPVVLEQNVPNPFNPTTRIRFHVPGAGVRATVTVYDVAGRELVALFDEKNVSGSKTVWWNGLQNDGRPAASGVYFYRLTAGPYTITRKMVLVR